VHNESVYWELLIIDTETVTESIGYEKSRIEAVLGSMPGTA